jgi:hypothetical protein
MGSTLKTKDLERQEIGVFQEIASIHFGSIYSEKER